MPCRLQHLSRSSRTLFDSGFREIVGEGLSRETRESEERWADKHINAEPPKLAPWESERRWADRVGVEPPKLAPWESEVDQNGKPSPPLAQGEHV